MKWLILIALALIGMYLVGQYGYLLGFTDKDEDDDA